MNRHCEAQQECIYSFFRVTVRPPLQHSIHHMILMSNDRRVRKAGLIMQDKWFEKITIMREGDETRWEWQDKTRKRQF